MEKKLIRIKDGAIIIMAKLTVEYGCRHQSCHPACMLATQDPRSMSSTERSREGQEHDHRGINQRDNMDLLRTL